ncbi:MAG: hypothetical protein CVV27_08825 [Candidatus Melainabacteria bacterium HGW-Melainabacteria-1]|nr:MAG: hypothetical protein CVV27_08825 [Candidatus Melainabacteria bacterium HGW-Melainabacteria-1]
MSYRLREFQQSRKYVFWKPILPQYSKRRIASQGPSGIFSSDDYTLLMMAMRRLLLGNKSKSGSRFRFKRISQRILSGFMLSVLLCLGLSGWFVLSIARNIATRKIAEADMQTVRRIAGIADTRMSLLESALRLQAVFLGEGFGDMAAIKRGIAALREGFPEIASAFVAAPSGLQLYRSDRLSLENVGGILAFQMARKGETIVSDVYPEPFSARPVRTITIPIHQGEFVTGVFSVDIDFGGLVEEIQNSRLDGKANLLVVSSSGRAVAHTALDQLKSLDLLKLPPVEIVLEGTEGSSDGYVDEFGVRVLGTYTPIPSLGWGVIIERPLKGIAAEVSRIQSVVLGSILFALAFSVLAGWIVSRRIAGPIVRLAAASERVAEGDFSQSIEKDGSDEIGALTESFNRMVEYLRTFSDDLQKANATLE